MSRWIRLLSRDVADPASLYDLGGEQLLVADTRVPLANMGYWPGIEPRSPRSLERACYALFELTASRARLEPRARVLDAGCGFGTNAIYLARHFEPERVIGVNVSRVQLQTARRLVHEAGLDATVQLWQASVTRLPLERDTIDAVISVEAAFHFDPREDFLAEALRVLRPGGRLSLVDIVAPAPRNPWERGLLATARRAQAIPAANIYDQDAYLERVVAAGFVLEEAESIPDRVFPPFRRWLITRSLRELLGHHWIFRLASVPYLFYPWDYLRLVARKPG